MFSIPLAAIGVVGGLLITNTAFSLQAYIGVIMLAGIVVSNAILLVDYTNTLRHRDGMALREAVELAGRTRLRPILMTSLTTVLGLVPMGLGYGEGAELQAPLARVVIFGLSASTIITLVFVPCMYTLFEEGLAGLRKGMAHAHAGRRPRPAAGKSAGKSRSTRRGPLSVSGSRSSAALPSSCSDRQPRHRVTQVRARSRPAARARTRRSRNRGCGTTRSGSSTTSSPQRIRSRSSVRGALRYGRSAAALPLDVEQQVEQRAGRSAERPRARR